MDKTRAVNAGITVKVSIFTSITEKEKGNQKRVMDAKNRFKIKFA